MFAATGLLEIAASGPGFGLEHTGHMNSVEITEEVEAVLMQWVLDKTSLTEEHSGSFCFGQ